MAILNWTTTVAVERSIAEIQRALAKGGARSTTVEYGPDGEVAAVRFALTMNGVPIAFRMPCNVEGVLHALQRARVPRGKCNRNQAARVAWRIVKDWTLVQLALVEAGQAQMAEVFLAYAVTRDGETAFAMFEKNARKLLLTGGEDD